jgi:hypothetical protein
MGKVISFFCWYLGLAAAVMIPVEARTQGSPYVPLDDVAYAYVDALMARGHLLSLPSLERPYTARAIRNAIDSSRGRMSSGAARLADLLVAALKKHGVGNGSASAHLSAELFVTSLSSTGRDLMHFNDETAMKPGAALRGTFIGGAVAAAFRPVLDNRFKVDPDFPGRKDRDVSGRTEDAYLSGQWPYAELVLGRLARNWGPYPIHGLQLGNYADTYDQAYVRFGLPAINASAMVTKLDHVFLPNGEWTRYFSIHRIAGRIGRLELAASEAYIYSGIGRSWEIATLNPLNVYALSWRNERVDGNLNFGFEAAYRSASWGTVAAHVMVDDFQIDSEDELDNEPNAYGLTLTAEGIPLFGEQRLFASYTRVSNLAYRTPNASERYAHFDVGLARPFSDYDEWRMGVDALAPVGVPVRLYLARRRQGEGDFRQPFPAPQDFETTPTIFAGVVETVTRVGFAAGAHLPSSLEASWDIGYNMGRSFGHMSGESLDRFVGRLRLAWVWGGRSVSAK